MNSILKTLLTLWFSTGLLNIQRVNWNSPASLGKKNFLVNSKLLQKYNYILLIKYYI
jgi:hypothetical protein